MNFDIKKPNIGNTDRIIRAGVAVLLILGAIRGGSWVAGVIGAVLLATAYFRFCPAYAATDFSTNKDTAPDLK
ncbi:DUF2892 domain-containing protein [uncultured Thiodictyon sp.]|uniref:YgaP family membrane protein n=1 Tax=uncultured Thiodictyon sp. TaxID=1846217 RepID=UPI0025CCA177|nr:DUF2892 domain-containing protein [uncultured Thiodictyon sp.]